jgi:phage terminase large subunit-like protein
LITTTQSDEIPTGAFRDELKISRRIRDGEYQGKIIRPTLPVLYEFPRDIAGDPERWGDKANWPMVMPNLGKSVHLESLYADWQGERDKGEQAIKIWASQHLNIEIGIGINNDGWRGADYWESATDESLSLEAILERSDVITVGIDGGGLDDLLGLAVIGRDKTTREWLAWTHAWANPKVLELRKDIASQLTDFHQEGTLSICDVPSDLDELAAILARLVASGLMPQKNAIGIDPNNAAAIIDALFAVGVTDGMLRRLLQGPALAPALYGLERKLSDGTFWHGGQLLMAWVLGNAKVEQRGNALMVTKQISGRAKIDPLIALFEAAIMMSWNPSAGMLITGADILTVI